MTTENNNSPWFFIKSLESFSDSVIKPIYSEVIMQKFDNSGILKWFANSWFINALQNFWKGWFKKVFVIFGWLIIVLGLFNAIMYALILIFTFYLQSLIAILLWILSVIVWVWIVRFKKWYWFIVIVSFVLGLINLIYSYFAYPSVMRFFFSWWQMLSLYTFIVSFLFSILFFIIHYALIIKNKELFVN